jgi:hypothetical protein
MEEKVTIAFNCLLVLSAAFCMWHSFSFKYEIRNTERRMILKSLDIGNIITGLIVIFQLTAVIFIEDTKYLGIMLLVVIVIDIFRIVLREYLETKSGGNNFTFRDYVHSVKMITIILFAVVLHGSLGAYALEKLEVSKDDSIYRAAATSFFSIEMRKSKEQYASFMQRIILMLVSLVVTLSLLEFLSKIKDGASFEVFDIHYSSDMVKALKNYEKEWTDPVTEGSFFYKYFLYKFNSILGIEEKQLFTNTFGFKKGYMRMLSQESSMAHRALDKFRSHFISMLSSNKKLWAMIWIILKWVDYVEADQ